MFLFDKDIKVPKSRTANRFVQAILRIESLKVDSTFQHLIVLIEWIIGLTRETKVEKNPHNDVNHGSFSAKLKVNSNSWANEKRSL